MARTATNSPAKPIPNTLNPILPVQVPLQLDIKSAAVTHLISKILKYSAIKINAKRPPPYSMLNPETSSDSPSAKSKGARFVSANIVTNHSANSIGITNRIQHPRTNRGVEKLYLPINNSPTNRKRAIVTSYEIV